MTAESNNEIMAPGEIKALSKKMGGGDKVQRKADKCPDRNSVPNAKLIPLFEDHNTNHVWTVRGSFSLVPYVVSLTSTMTIYRNKSNNELTIFNAFRCSESLEKEILALGKIAHIVKLGQFHGDADAYYIRAPQFGKPKLWTLPNGSVAKGTTADEILSSTHLPILGAKLYSLKGHPFPEGLMTVPVCNGSSGPLLIACDSLIHVPDLSIASYMARFLFWCMGFNLQTARNVPKAAPLWCKMSVGAVGADTVRVWYQDIAAMEWTSCVGGHGTTAVDCNDHADMMAAVEAQIQAVAPK